jgi:hypothetical protein
MDPAPEPTIRPMPWLQTVTAKAGYADTETIKKARGKGFPKPKQASSRGDDYVAEGYEKRGTFVIDLVTRKVGPQQTDVVPDKRSAIRDP